MMALKKKQALLEKGDDGVRKEMMSSTGPSTLKQKLKMSD